MSHQTFQKENIKRKKIKVLLTFELAKPPVPYSEFILQLFIFPCYIQVVKFLSIDITYLVMQGQSPISFVWFNVKVVLFLS